MDRFYRDRGSAISDGASRPDSTGLAPADGATAEDVPRYFQVSTSKLAVMSIFTFGIYTTYWFYKQWKAVQRAGVPKVSPFWRTVLAPFFAVQLFEEVQEDALDHDIQPRWSPHVYGAIYFFSCVGVLLPPPFSVPCIAGLLVTLPVQRTMLDIATKSGLSFQASEGYSLWNILGILLGVTWLMFSGLWALWVLKGG